MASLIRAVQSGGKKAIKIEELRFNKVALHIEKLSITPPKVSANGLNSIPEHDSDENTAVSTSDNLNKASNHSMALHNEHNLKPGILNLWAAMGATNPQQEASMLSSVSSQMSGAVEGSSNMVNALGSAVSKFNPTSFLLRSGTAVTSSIGTTLGSGFSMLTGMGATSQQAAKVNAEVAAAAAGSVSAANGGSGGSGGCAGGGSACTPAAESVLGDMERTVLAATAAAEAVERAVDKVEEEEEEEEEEDSDEEVRLNFTAKKLGNSSNGAGAAAAAGGAKTAPALAGTAIASPAVPNSIRTTPIPSTGSCNSLINGKDSSASSSNSSTAGQSGPNSPKATSPADGKGFGLPYLFEIDALQLDRLELHTQDFLNANHAKATKASIIKLKSLSMSRHDLTKPSKLTKEEKQQKVKKYRRPLYLDDVVWRLVNKLLAELLLHNSIAMMVLLSSAAANHTTSVVSSAGSLAYHGAASSGRLLTRAGSVFTGRGSVSSGAAGASAGASAGGATAAASAGGAGAASGTVPAPVAGTAARAVPNKTTCSSSGKGSL
jgi:hypothetical protein